MGVARARRARPVPPSGARRPELLSSRLCLCFQMAAIQPVEVRERAQGSLNRLRPFPQP